MFNEEGECGTGAVVPWADRLWVITYAPHEPKGSSDKLYEITPDLKQIIRPESVGGTPANRMIHRESNQLFIGPYVIDGQRQVRVIPPSAMYGRLTGNARHLEDPTNRIYYATMEEGIYEVDVHSLKVSELWTDEQIAPAGDQQPSHANLPGYHGKGLYSGQGLLIYANNGEHGEQARLRPDVPSGVLAAWPGPPAPWTIVRRNQFTEVTGPGGLFGNEKPETDPVWSIGWDHRSLILMVLHHRTWHAYRLPKSSHSYDGAHGWNTEWPRIRDIGQEDLLMTMHGALWRFPRSFQPAKTIGLAPRSNYLKVIGDFCRWQNRVVFGCDDTAKNEFLNKRKAKGEIAAPQSQSNLWFVDPEQLDDFGPVLGRGGVWVREDISAKTHSEPFLVGGYDRVGLHLSHAGAKEATFLIEQDLRGDGRWTQRESVTVPAFGYRHVPIVGGNAAWIRLRSPKPLTGATAWFDLSNQDPRTSRLDNIFDGLAAATATDVTAGLIRARGGNKRTLSLAAMTVSKDGAKDIGYYELDANLALRRIEDEAAHAFAKSHTAIPRGVLQADEASVLFIDDAGQRWRLPRGSGAADISSALGSSRAAREVATERDLFHAHGTFYELPAENAGGFAKVRPISTHNLQIHDFCSYRGLFVMTGVSSDLPSDNPHIIRSDDGRAALWVGAIDDVWRMGKPRGHGGPWKNTAVQAGQTSDPYLMTGFDRKTLRLSHDSTGKVLIALDADITGGGHWIRFREFDVPAGETLDFVFPETFSAYWIRTTAFHDCSATAQLYYD